MKKKLFNFIINYKLISVFFIIIIFFTITNFNTNNYLKNKISDCSNISFEESQLIKPNKFSSFKIILEIDSKRKWSKIFLNNFISNAKNGRYLNKGKVNANLIINVSNKMSCALKVKIRPHGDTGVHHPGFDNNDQLPSLNVDILNGHIFGITKFILLKPASRNNDNEILLNTLMQELKYLAPRTAKVFVEYNDHKYKFLFQERIVKEFLEFNNLVEGPIYKGDERFSFDAIKYGYKKPKNSESFESYIELGISKHKLSNGKWAVASKENLNLASAGLEILNVSNHFYKSNYSQFRVIDYFTSQKDSTFGKFYTAIPEYDALIFSLAAEHSLSRDDRRFYFDIHKNKFLPILYDGKAQIFKNINNELDPLFIDILKVWKTERLTLKVHGVISSAITGSKKALEQLNTIDENNLHKILEKRGLIIDINLLKNIIKTLKKNLNLLNQLDDQYILIAKNEAQNDLKNIKAFEKNLKIKYLFKDQLNNSYNICNFILEKCYQVNLNNESIKKALEQELKDEDKNHLIYLGVREHYENNEGYKDITNNYKKIEVNGFNSIKTIGDIDIRVNHKTKIIKITKKNYYDRVIFNDGEIKDWTIKFDDYSKEYENNDANLNGLNGCLNFLDIKFKNVKIIVDGANCEDAVNIIRGSGNISEVNINNSSFDGIDLDFSKLKINKVNIKNSGNDCIDLSYGNYYLDFVYAKNCGDKIVSVGENSLLYLNNIIATNAKYGLVSKDYSEVILNNGKIENADTCLAVYSKKQEFSGGKIIYNKITCNKFRKKIFEEQGSIIKKEINL